MAPKRRSTRRSATRPVKVKRRAAAGRRGSADRFQVRDSVRVTGGKYASNRSSPVLFGKILTVRPTKCLIPGKLATGQSKDRWTEVVHLQPEPVSVGENGGSVETVVLG